jgi:hypothetical protein
LGDVSAIYLVIAGKSNAEKNTDLMDINIVAGTVILATDYWSALILYIPWADNRRTIRWTP